MGRRPPPLNLVNKTANEATDGEPVNYLSKAQRKKKKEKERRARMAQEHNSKVLGDALEVIMQERKYEEKTTQRRNSASERLNIPLLD